ncbi:glycosyltransferase, partial [Porticoccaceae bacterium]|nr:glycosyltransferase [Porticoccaceae bacterium]
PFGELPDRIRSADIALGIFGVGEKSSRVIPNKAYQSLACGLPLITMRSDAYPADLGQEQGLFFVPPGDPQAIAEALATCSAKLDYTLRDATAHTYQRYFSSQQIGAALSATMAELDVK